MAPRSKFTRQELIDAAFKIVREQGSDALTAKAIADELHISTRPIFTCFGSMDEVRREVRAAAEALYDRYTAEGFRQRVPFFGFGMQYIRFAKEERELFRLLFMCDRSNETVEDDRASVRPLLEIIQSNLNINEDEAYLFHLEMWIYAHGIATMIATSFLNWDDALISKLLSDAYEGLKHRYMEGKNHAGNQN